MITNLNNYLRQHSEIAKISKLIEDSALLNNEKIVENVKDIYYPKFKYSFWKTKSSPCCRR